MIAAVGAVLAAVLGFAAFGGTALTALAVGLVQAALLVGWLRSVPTPEPLLGVLLAAAAAAGADALVLATGGSHPLEGVALMLGPVVVAMFLTQLVRTAPRPGITTALTATALLVAVAVLAATYIGARQTHGGAPLVAATAAGVAVAALAALVPAGARWHRRFSAPEAGRVEHVEPVRPERTSLEPVVRALAAGVVGGGAGALVGALTDLGAGAGTWLGATAAVVASVGRVLAADATRVPVPEPTAGSDPAAAARSDAPGTATSVLPAAAAPPATADPGMAVLVAAALPVALAGPVAYVLGRILVG